MCQKLGQPFPVSNVRQFHSPNGYIKLKWDFLYPNETRNMSIQHYTVCYCPEQNCHRQRDITMVTTEGNIHIIPAHDLDVVYKVFIYGVTEHWNSEKNNLSMKQAQRVLMRPGYHGKYFKSSFFRFYFLIKILLKNM